MLAGTASVFDSNQGHSYPWQKELYHACLPGQMDQDFIWFSVRNTNVAKPTILEYLLFKIQGPFPLSSGRVHLATLSAPPANCWQTFLSDSPQIPQGLVQNVSPSEGPHPTMVPASGPDITDERTI